MVTTQRADQEAIGFAFVCAVSESPLSTHMIHHWVGLKIQGGTELRLLGPTTILSTCVPSCTMNFHLFYGVGTFYWWWCCRCAGGWMQYETKKWVNSYVSLLVGGT